MEQKLSVTAIEEGTVIDHISAGEGLHVVRLLGLADHKKRVTLGLNLPSQSLGLKDIIKVEEREISKEEANQIAVFSPSATINIIRGFQIVQKFVVAMPDTLSNILPCPNQKCITNHEQISTKFRVNRQGGKVMLHCHYCERVFVHENI